MIGKIADDLLNLGKSDEAVAAFNEALVRARALNQDRAAQDITYSLLVRLGGALAVKGDSTSSLRAYEEAEGLLRGFLRTDPKGMSPRGDLTILLISKSHMQTRDGRPDAATAGLREAIALAAGLAAERPDDFFWTREQVVAYSRLGDTLNSQGDPADAIDAYRQSLALAQSIPAPRRAAADVELIEMQTEEALGLVLEGQQDVDAALAATSAALTLRKAAAEVAPEDAEKVRMQYVDESVVGRLLFTAGRTDDALVHFRDGLTLARRLAALPDAGPTARSGVAVSLMLIGMSLNRRGDPAAASAAYGEAVPILQALVRDDPTKVQFRQQLGFTALDLGDALNAQNDRAGALTAYVKARDAASAIPAQTSPNAKASDQLKQAVGRIGAVANALLLAGAFSDALSALDEARPMAPDQNWLDLVRGAALMFLDRPDEARALYEKHRGETTFGGKSWETATLEGFALLRKQGLEKPLMSEIESDFGSPK